MRDEEVFKIFDSKLTFDDNVSDASSDIISVLREKEVIILPSHGYEDLYYEGSLETLDYLNENNIKADIYATDEEYKEIALYSSEIWLGTFLLKNFVIPVFTGLLSTYIYSKLKAKPKDSISLTLIAEKKDGETRTIEYKGKVENLDKVIKSLKEVSNDN